MRKTYGPYLSGGYLVRVTKENGRIVDCTFLHREVMEKKLGRPLRRGEVVHHLDGNKRNNDPANLGVVGYKGHLEAHGRLGRTMLDLTCDFCGRRFQREQKESKASKGYRFSYCSRSCAAHAAGRGRPKQAPAVESTGR